MSVDHVQQGEGSVQCVTAHHVHSCLNLNDIQHEQAPHAQTRTMMSVNQAAPLRTQSQQEAAKATVPLKRGSYTELCPTFSTNICSHVAQKLFKGAVCNKCMASSVIMESRNMSPY